MIFAIRGDVASDMGAQFHLTDAQLGAIWSPAFWAFTVSIFMTGALVDAVGLRALHVSSAVGYLIGLALVLAAPHPTGPVVSIFSETGPLLLYCGFFIMGLSQGVVEGVINPLVASIYPDEKTRKLNMLHAWWPGGLIIGGLLAVALTSWFHASWQIKLASIFVPAVAYLLLAMVTEYPPTERAASNITTAQMWREAGRPMFLILFACMWLTTAAEVGPNQWFPKIMGDLVPQMQGVLFLVYTAGLAFVLRFYFSGWAHDSPIRTMLICSAMTAVGLVWLGALKPGTSPLLALAPATLFGFGTTYFWPTMLGVTSEQIPRGGALLINLMGGAGYLAIAILVPLMGVWQDKYGAGAALQYVAVLPAILVVVFSGFLMYFKAQGGYKAQTLAG